MSFRFREVDFESLEDCACLARWENDPIIRDFLVPCFSLEEPPQKHSAEEIRSQHSERTGSRFDLFALWDEIPVGHGSLAIDAPPAILREGKVGWVSVVVGNTEFRRRGLASAVLVELERMARELGATHLEAGVFEFNEPSLALFRGLGWNEFQRIPNFTHWQGKRWADVRFFKPINLK